METERKQRDNVKERKKREKVICSFYSFLITSHCILLFLSHSSCNMYAEPYLNRDVGRKWWQHDRREVYEVKAAIGIFMLHI